MSLNTLQFLSNRILIYPKSSHRLRLITTPEINKLCNRHFGFYIKKISHTSLGVFKGLNPERTLLQNTNGSNSLWSRHLSSHFNPQKNKESQENRLNNEIEPATEIGKGTWKEVYSGVLTTQLKLLKMFSISSSIMGITIQPILYEKLGTANLGVVVTLATFLTFFTFITPALIHWVSKKYVTKLEYDPEKDVYAATTLSFFLREKKVHFKVEDVYRPDIPGMFTSFLVKNRPLFVHPDMFEDLDHYSRIMGYDKPIDFSLDRNKKKPH